MGIGFSVPDLSHGLDCSLRIFPAFMICRNRALFVIEDDSVGKGSASDRLLGSVQDEPPQNNLDLKVNYKNYPVKALKKRKKQVEEK